MAFHMPPSPHHSASLHFYSSCLSHDPPLRELLMMNQFQALFESFLTTDGVPALTFCNEVRSPYLPVRVKEKRKKINDLFSPRQEETVNGQTEIQGCIAQVNLICHKKKKNKKKRQKRGRRRDEKQMRFKVAIEGRRQKELQGYPTN